MLKIKPMGPYIGGEITGIDVKTLPDGVFEKIYRAWLNYGVTVVRDQDLQLMDFLEYGRRFGTIIPHPSKSTRHPSHPEITVLGENKFNIDGTVNDAIYRRGADGFHTDGAYDKKPFKATKLYALEVPSRGGNTHFCCMYSAYKMLPARLQKRIEEKIGAFTYGGRSKKQELLNPEDRDKQPAFHPLVRTHPETKRKSLYFDPGKITFIAGVDQAESDDIIDELSDRIFLPDTEYIHQWRVGDVVIWDNRCLLHKAAGDYPPEENRIHWRVSIKES